MERESDPELEYSPLSRRLSSNGKSVEVQIFRIVGESGWALEAVDEFNNSTVWDELFDSDAAALELVRETIEKEGIEVLIGKPGNGSS